GKKSRPGVGVCLATAVTSTTVSPIETRTAPSAWRATSPVSMVIECGPYGNDLLTTLTALILEKFGNPWGPVAQRPRERGPWYLSDEDPGARRAPGTSRVVWTSGNRGACGAG